MKIHLEYVAMLAVKGARSGSEIELPDGATIGTLLEKLQVAPAHCGSIAPFVNNERVRQTAVLKTGDRVFLALPISGG